MANRSKEEYRNLAEELLGASKFKIKTQRGEFSGHLNDLTRDELQDIVTLVYNGDIKPLNEDDSDGLTLDEYIALSIGYDAYGKRVTPGEYTEKKALSASSININGGAVKHSTPIYLKGDH